MKEVLVEILRVVWWFSIGLMAAPCILWSIDWLVRKRPRQQPIVLNRPLFVMLRILDGIERDTGRRCGCLLISAPDFRMLLRDLRRHKDPIVHSGRGILIRGICVAPESRLDVADMCFVSPTKDVARDYCRN